MFIVNLPVLVYRRQEKLEYSIDIGIVPSHGLVPPTLCVPSYTYPEIKCKTSLKQNTSSQVSTKVSQKDILNYYLHDILFTFFCRCLR